MDTVKLAGVELDTVGALFRFDDATHAKFTASALSANGPTVATVGTWSSAAGDNVVLDSLGLTVGDARWHLAGPTLITRDSVGARLDSLRAAKSRHGVDRVDGEHTDRWCRLCSAPRVARAAARHQPPRSAPRFVDWHRRRWRVGQRLEVESANRDDGRSTGIKWKDVAIDSVITGAKYSEGRVRVDLGVVRDGRRAVTANGTLPYTVTLFGVRRATTR